MARDGTSGTSPPHARREINDERTQIGDAYDDAVPYRRPQRCGAVTFVREWIHLADLAGAPVAWRHGIPLMIALIGLGLASVVVVAVARRSVPAETTGKAQERSTA